MNQTNNPTAETFLADYSPAVRELALHLRGILLAAIPDVQEVVKPGWKEIWYMIGSAKMVNAPCILTPLKDSVNIVFSRGAKMSNAQGLLQGTGKSGRHVKYRKVEEVDPATLQAMIAESMDLMRDDQLQATKASD